jgi:hypothetical protein
MPNDPNDFSKPLPATDAGPELRAFLDKLAEAGMKDVKVRPVTEADLDELARAKEAKVFNPDKLIQEKLIQEKKEALIDGVMKLTDVTPDKIEQARAESEAEIAEVVAATMTLIRALPPEHRMTGLFLHFCVMTDSVEHGMKIGATCAYTIANGPKERWNATKAITASAAQEYMSTITRAVTAAYIKEFASGKTEDEIMEGLGDLEAQLFPDRAEEIAQFRKDNA